MEAGTRGRAALPFAFLTVWLLAIAFVRPLSVDESQYVAATALTAKGLLPYLDYAYLQTPLQPFAFSPLQWLFAGHLLLAMRIANALLGAATIILVHATARRLGAGDRSALAAAAMMASCQSFSWSAGVSRNDMLPAALMMAGLWLVTRPARSWGMTVLAGAAFGLAASAKISFAVPAAAIFIAWFSDRGERKRSLAFAAGVAIGLVPTLLLIAAAPRAFLTEAIVFPAQAPAQYYTEIGNAWRLGPARFLQLIATAAVGPALIAAVEVGRRGRSWFGDPARRTMLAAALGGLISAVLNKPFQIFYLLPALPPLFVLAALLFDGKKVAPWRKPLWGVCVAAGLVPVLAWFVHAIIGVAPALDADRRTAALRAALQDAHVEGPVATLASQYVDHVDPRLAAGPFLYRTRGFIAADDARAWHIVTREQGQLLAKDSPAAIVTGHYPDAQQQQEAELAAQARTLGYRPSAAPGGFTLWLP